MASLTRRLTPLADRVLVRKLLPQTKTAGGLYLRKWLENSILLFVGWRMSQTLKLDLCEIAI
jgi:hypothetical protein